MITVCILTKNAQDTLKKTLDSLTQFPEVLILDNGSEDNTLTIAKSYSNVTIHHSPFIGFGPLRNLAATFAKEDWILAIDSDEVVSKELYEEIQALKKDPSKVYAIPRHNYFLGKWIKGAGWHPEKVVRLYHKEKTSYSDHQVHESVIAKKEAVVSLKAPLLHTPYRSIAELLKKMDLYSTLFAKQNHKKKRSSMKKAIAHAFFAFFRSYILKKGIFCGKEGLIISFYNAHTTFYKYVKLMEMNEYQDKI